MADSSPAATTAPSGVQAGGGRSSVDAACTVPGGPNGSSRPAGSPTTKRRGRHLMYDIMGHYGLLIALIIAVAGFSLARPSSFWTTGNLQDILTQSSAPAILAIGLTMVLVVGDFDLSIGSTLGLGGGAAVAMMSLHGTDWEVGVIVALAIGLVAGLINGVLIAYLKMSSFIVTLAMGTILLGVNFLVAGNQTLFANIAPVYLDFGRLQTVGNINVQVFIALGVAMVAWVALERTEAGRYMYAVGGNSNAARLSGLAVQRYRLAGFVLAAIAAVIAGILVTAQGGAAIPDAGASYLLPAYAAAFLGTAGFSEGAFNVAGTVVGVIFLSVIAAGLTMFGISTGWIDIVQGAILVFAIMVSDIGRRMVMTSARPATGAS
jgi:ribose transport system permease protein